MISIQREMCIGCGACVKDCGRKVLAMEDGKPVVKGGLCNGCLHCYAICPVGAVSCTEPTVDGAEEWRYSENRIDPDQLLRAMKSRRSIRQFRDQPVEREKLLRILEAARYAPTAGNQQTTEFVVLQDTVGEVVSGTLQMLKAAAEEPANAAVPVPEQYRERWIRMEKDYREQGVDGLFYGGPAVLLVTGPDAISASLTAANAELMSYALGLGCVYVGFLQYACAVNPGVMEPLLGFAPGQKLVCALVIGYPAVDYPRTPSRRSREIPFR